MKLNRIIYASFMMLSLTACNLDYNPTSAIANSTLTEEDYQYLLVGVYNGAQQFSMGHLYVIDEVAADNLNCQSWYTEVDDNNLTSNYSSVNNWWEALYGSIQLCNNLINLIADKGDEATTSQIEIMAQARVIRAWLYMKVVALWGDAPCLTEVTEEAVPRDPEGVIWQLVKEDCEYGMEHAPSFSTAGYVSNIAAKALLARVLLIGSSEVQDKNRAAQLANEVIEDGRFELADDYSDIWHSKTSDEMILQWTNISGDSGSPGWFLRSNIVTTYNNTYGDGAAGYGELGRYEFPVDQAMMNAYEPEDTQRKNASVRHLTLPDGTETYDCVKFPSYDASDPWPVVRIAEMYLIEAEAEGYPDGLTRLNQLREKRGLNPLVAGIDITASDFLKKIMQERRVELFCEGHRWYDLRRWFNTDEQGKADVLELRCYQVGEAAGSRSTASDKMNISDNGYNLLWPVPATAIDNDPNLLPNNPGY